MTTWYKASGNAFIEPVDVVKVNAKTIVLRVKSFRLGDDGLDDDMTAKGPPVEYFHEVRVNIRSDFDNYFKTRLEAILHLKTRAETAVESLTDKLFKMKTILGHIQDLERSQLVDEVEVPDALVHKAYSSTHSPPNAH